MGLTDTALRALKPRAKAYKVSDERGLYVQVTPSGGKLWRFKYQSAAAGERKLSFGSYPDVPLKDARARRDEARRLLAEGVDPSDRKRQEKHAAKIRATNTFRAVAEAYISKNERDGLADATIRKRRWFLSLVDRTLGHRPVEEIEPFAVLEAVRPFEAARNDEKAHRTLEFVGQVFRFAVASQLAPSDPTRDLRGALASRRPKHLAAIVEPKRVGDLLRAIEIYDGHPITKIALELSPHLFVRPGELRKAEWSELDLEGAVWRIGAQKMKARKEHAVPLSQQTLSLFRSALAITGGEKYVFPSLRGASRCMLKSFHLETLALDILTDVTISSFPSGVRFFFDKARTRIRTKLADPAGYSDDVAQHINTTEQMDVIAKRLDWAFARAHEAEKFAAAGRTADAFARWSQLIPNHFPAYD